MNYNDFWDNVLKQEEWNDELECDYFICGDYTFNPYWEEN